MASKEKFLVLEVTPQGTNALFLSVDEERNLIFEKFIPGADLGKLLRSPWQKMSQKSWEGNYLFGLRRKVIVAADPSVATTMPIPLDLSRDRAEWHSELTLLELENLIAQAMAKIFTQCRSEASKRLGIDDINTILVGAKTLRFKMDGHSVMNPVGFTGKKISLLLELTFTSRAVFEELQQFFNSPEEFFFVESPQALMLTVARSRRLPLNVIAPDGKKGSSLFIFEDAGHGYPVLYRQAFDWSFGSIFRHITDEMGVSEKMAQDLYRAYRKGELSPSAERAFKKTIQPAVEELLEKAVQAKIGGFVYVDAAHPTPLDLPYKYKGMTFEALPAEAVFKEFDLEVDPELLEAGSPVAFRHLAPFLEAYFAKTTSEINQKLRRRLHWLA